MKEHTCKFKRKKPTQSRSLEQHMTLAKVSLYCNLNANFCWCSCCLAVDALRLSVGAYYLQF